LGERLLREKWSALGGRVGINPIQRAVETVNPAEGSARGEN